MTGRVRSWFAWALFLASVALVVAAAFIATLNEKAGVGEFQPLDLFWASSWLGLSVVGAVVAYRRPDNKVGWLACTFSLPISFLLFANEYGRYTLVARPRSLPGGGLIFWMSQWPFFIAGAIGVFVVLLFPDGRLPSPRWRFVAWTIPIGTALGVIGAAFGRYDAGTFDYEGKVVENPLLISRWAGLLEELQGLSGTVLGGVLVLSFVAAIFRLRRARGEERQQMKWFFYGFAVMLGLWMFLFVLENILGRVPEPFDTILFSIGVLAVPAGIAVAILRFRLYDIDVVINKTLVYGALAAFITAVYVGVVVGIGSAVGAGGEPNLGLSLAATANVAIAFQPVRQRVQRLANRLVYGERVTPYEAVTSFSHRMAESLSLDQVLPQMAEAAAKGVGGNRARVKLILPGGAEQVITWPQDSSGNSFDRILKVSHQGEEVGEISVAKRPGEQITKSEEKLLKDLASQAGLAMRNLRLTGELQQKLIELQESRKRIVAAQDDERRRMETDIRKGAGSQLAKIAEMLELADAVAPTDAHRAAAILDELRSETEIAVEAVRDLARGLFPKILVDRGLLAAVESHVQKVGLPVRVEAAGLADTRLDPGVESNMFFCIREALQIAAMHPKDTAITLSLAIVDSALEFFLRDESNESSLEKDALGSSFQNIEDRIEALGGTCKIQRAPRGTELEARVPLTTMDS